MGKYHLTDRPNVAVRSSPTPAVGDPATFDVPDAVGYRPISGLISLLTDGTAGDRRLLVEVVVDETVIFAAASPSLQPANTEYDYAIVPGGPSIALAGNLVTIGIYKNIIPAGATLEILIGGASSVADSLGPLHLLVEELPFIE